ncbi:zf-HC2 domain-containing protein [Streptomyces sp. P9-A4]|uniref:zf-HC2 domain-containing protein n=1 Tax=Streptomyces sp. P9-A4 TaxID=3072285 RepID=UPI002FC598F8
MSDDLTCEGLRELDAELALGVLPARERALAVAHLDHCPGCREHIARLTPLGDGLLGLLPGSEPPVGFETRVTARFGELFTERSGERPERVENSGRPEHHKKSDRPERSRTSARRRLLRPRLAAAGAALAIACGFGGWAVGTAVNEPLVASAPAHPAHSGLMEAALVADGHEVGRIYAHPGTPGWVYMSVELSGRDGPVRCRLERTDGSAVPLGSFALKGGYGYWGAPANVDPSALSGAQLLAPDGSVLATAHFPSAVVAS